MIATRATPRLMLLGLTLQAGVWMGLHLPVLFGREIHFNVIEGTFQSAASILAFALALALNVEIAGEYRQTPWLRWAWLFLGANAGLSMLREVVQNQHLVIVPANSFLVLGLLGMWWAYRQVGLGFVTKGYDYAQIAGIVCVLLALLFSRRGLTQAESPYLVGRVLQHVGLLLLATAAAASVVLHRMALQMGGGKLARALRCLTLYAALRATLVLAEALLFLHMPEWRQTNGLLHFLDTFCWQTVPWLAALAGAYRADLTVHAQKELQRYLAGKAAPIAA